MKEFEDEISKVSGPIVEKYQSVETRVIKPDVGNPSDGCYVEESKKKTTEVEKA